MPSKSFITLHIVNDIPWSNLNRDDSGTPKRTVLGGVERGLLSSQSIKRAIRKDYESRVLELFPDAYFNDFNPMDAEAKLSEHASIRSRYLATWATKRAAEIAAERNVSFDEKKANRTANAAVKKLVGGEDTIIWLSLEELDAFAHALVEELAEDAVLNAAIPEAKRTGALAIAAFGRMFANAQDKSTDAAIAVSPAISMHANLIETDYFIAGDDFGFFKKDKKTGEVEHNFEGAGAAHLGTALYTSGIFYRTVTIDVKDLHRSWSGISSEHAEVLVAQLVRSIVHCLPTGKKNHTAPYTVPQLIIAEEQGYREAYSIADPVEVEEEGGFLSPSIRSIAKQFKLAREFNGSNYGEAAITGARARELTDTPITTEDLVQLVTSWIMRWEEPKYLDPVETGEVEALESYQNDTEALDNQSVVE